MANRIEENIDWMKENRDDLVETAKEFFADGETKVWLVLSDSFDQNPAIWTEADRNDILNGYAKNEYSFSVTDTPEAIEAIAEIQSRYESDFDSDRGVIEITPDML